MEGTDVGATTVHALFQLDGELHSKLDFSKLDDARVTFLMQLEVLMLDEACLCLLRPATMRIKHVSLHERARANK